MVRSSAHSKFDVAFRRRISAIDASDPLRESDGAAAPVVGAVAAAVFAVVALL